MPNLPGVLIAALSVVIAVGALVLALRRLSRRGGLGEVDTAPEDPGAPLAEAEGLYLATTVAGAPLERARIPELLFRSRAVLRVHERGVRLQRRDGVEAWIPAERITGAGVGTYTIDRAVEAGGLTVLGWMIGGTAVESSIRLDGHAEAVIEAVERIRVAPASAFPESPGTEERS